MSSTMDDEMGFERTGRHDGERDASWTIAVEEGTVVVSTHDAEQHDSFIMEFNDATDATALGMAMIEAAAFVTRRMQTASG